MNRVFAGFLGFIGGLIAGYCAVLFGWIGYAELFQVFDRDGGKIMGIAFFFAPLGGLIAGIVCAILLVRLAGRAKEAGA